MLNRNVMLFFTNIFGDYFIVAVLPALIVHLKLIVVNRQNQISVKIPKYVLPES